MPMPKPVKVGLIVLAALVVIGGGTCAGFVAWVKSNEADWRATPSWAPSSISA
jgi:hypothetical protein